MSFRETLVSSQAEAEQLLHDTLVAGGVRDFSLVDEPASGHFIGLKAIKLNAAPKDENIFQLNMGYDPETRSCYLDAIGVGDTFKGKLGLGRVGMKAALGIAYEKFSPYLSLRGVHLDGPSFWSYYGAVLVPPDEPKALPERLQERLADRNNPLNITDRLIFEQAKNIAESSCTYGWLFLSQADDLTKEGRKIRHEIFDGFCQTYVQVGNQKGKISRNMTLYMKHDDITKILEKRLGRIPDFQNMPEPPAQGIYVKPPPQRPASPPNRECSTDWTCI